MTPSRPIPNQVAERFLGSHILLRCDLRHTSAVTIHLGVLAELVTAEWHLFGIAARVSLEKSEIDVLPAVWRERLARPFDYFMPAFERAWKTAKAGECIDLLVSEYGGSLLIQPPSVLPVPPLPERVREADRVGSLNLRGSVLTSIDREANNFLIEPPAVTLHGPAHIYGQTGARSSAGPPMAIGA
jgi:hypothetical protein